MCAADDQVLYTSIPGLPNTGAHQLHVLCMRKLLHCIIINSGLLKFIILDHSQVYINGKMSSPLFTKSGNLFNRWYLGEVPINLQSTFQIAFEGIRGTNVQGDLAIDDVMLKLG